MKTVICCLNSKYIHSSLAPWCLAAGVETFSVCPHTVQIIEGTINQTPESICRRLVAEQAEVLAFCCYIWNILMVKQLVGELSQLCPHTTIVLGGPEASFQATALLKELPGISYVQIGEGEHSFPRLLDCLSLHESTQGIPGLCDRFTQNLPEVLETDLPSPYTPAYFSALKGRIAYLETSRGCPFSCSFCLSGRQDPVRFLELELAKKRMLLLANSGARTVKLVDRTFNCHPARSRELFRFLIEQAGTGIPKGVCFHFEVAGDLFDEQTLSLLATAPPGLMQMEIGLQSFYTPTLDAICRKTNLQQLCANIETILSPQNIHIHIDLIAGLPYETMSLFAKSFDKAYALQPHMLQLGFLKLLHGAPLRKQADAWGYVYENVPPYVFKSNPWLTAEEVQALSRLEDTLERLYNSGRFLYTLSYLLEVTDYQPFALFSHISECMPEMPGVSLDTYTAALKTCLETFPHVDSARLRDIMVCDSLSSHSNGRLPSCLYKEDSRLKKIARLTKGVKRGIAILYSYEEQVVLATYTHRDPVTNRYILEWQPPSHFGV